jgi:hypothetical protein
LHVILQSPGGVGENAIRMARSLQARCRELTIIVPDVAKSASTLLALAAHHIVMGPASDLGPIDPQYFMPDGRLASAKDIISAVEDATLQIEQRPETFPLYASMLSDVTAVFVQECRAALDQSAILLREALAANPDRTEEQVVVLVEDLTNPLIADPKVHGATFGAIVAGGLGLPVVQPDLNGDQWQMIWRLWAKYFPIVASNYRVYEGGMASRVIPWPEPPS